MSRLVVVLYYIRQNVQIPFRVMLAEVPEYSRHQRAIKSLYRSGLDVGVFRGVKLYVVFL